MNQLKAMLLSFHHFGLAVKKPLFSISLFAALGYEIGEPLFDPEQNVHLIMCSHPTQPAVEIIYPGSGTGPVDALVQRHDAGIVYHLCYETPDLGQTLEQWKNANIQVDCVVAPKPAPLFSGRKASFYRVKGMGLIEILEPLSSQESSPPN